jgi:hypothetical protein
MHRLAKVKGDRFEMSTRSTFAMCLVGLILGFFVYRLHLAQKWDAAIVGTLVPFWYLAGVFRPKWALASFWMSFAISFLAHVLFVWLAFEILFRDIDTVGIFLWIPATLVEGLALYYLIGALERVLARFLRPGAAGSHSDSGC